MTKSLFSCGRCLLAGIGLFLGAPAVAQPASDHGVQPWTETIISVSEFEPATRLFRIAGDWQLRLSGPVESGEIGYWRLPPDASPRFELWCAPGAVTGCIRFVQFTELSKSPYALPPEPGTRAGFIRSWSGQTTFPAYFKGHRTWLVGRKSTDPLPIRNIGPAQCRPARAPWDQCCGL